MTQDRQPAKPPTPHWQVVEQALDHHQRDQRRARRARRARHKAGGRAAAAPELPVVFVSDDLARQTARLLEVASVVYWFGFDCDDRASVTTLIIPEDDRRTDSILASAVADEELFSTIVGASLAFLGQVRKRPDADDPAVPGPGRDVRFEGAFSIDVPRNGSGASVLELERCVVHRQVAGEPHRIAGEEMRSHLRVIPGFRDLRKSGADV